jgi:hypothetical protein
MAGATGSNQDMVVGRTNWADGRTILWAKVPPGQSNFWGDAILIVEVAEDADDPDDYEAPASFIPSNRFHGIVAVGHSGGGASGFGGTPGASGVIGRGGRNQGTGVVGLAGGVPEPESNGAGGIGVHGLGGSQVDLFPDPSISPGAGVIGQGGRQTDGGNRARLPHAAGVIGIGGGMGPNKDLLPAHPITATGGVGVYGQGAEATEIMVAPLDADGNPTTGANVPSGPLAPGPGVLGRGGMPIPPRGPVAAGVIGLAGDTMIPDVSETGNSGVYGAGPTGVFGHGPTGVRGQGDAGPGVHGVGMAGDSRGGQFESTRAAQVQLVPHDTREPSPPSASITPEAVIVSPERGMRLPKDGRGGDLIAVMDDQRQCTLWFCVKGSDSGAARWAQVLVGKPFEGIA